MAKNPPHFVRDPSLASDIADQFGGGAGNAEQLIEANNLRYSEDLTAAQLLAPDADREGDFDLADIASAAGLSEDDLESYSVRGDYVVFAYTASDGRTHKEALRIEDGKLGASDAKDSPARTQLRAAVAATNQVNDAKAKAEQIVADAEAKAAEIVAKAAADAEADRNKVAVDAAHAAAKDAEKSDKPAPKS